MTINFSRFFTFMTCFFNFIALEYSLSIYCRFFGLVFYAISLLFLDVFAYPLHAGSFMVERT